jgi:hypothetical protein
VQQFSWVAPQLLKPLPVASQLVPVVVEPAHAPLLHMPVAQGEGLPHCPVAPHVSTVVPEHCCVPGVHPPPSPPPPELEPAAPLLDEPPEVPPLPEPALPDDDEDLAGFTPASPA